MSNDTNSKDMIVESLEVIQKELPEGEVKDTIIGILNKNIPVFPIKKALFEGDRAELVNAFNFDTYTCPNCNIAVGNARGNGVYFVPDFCSHCGQKFVSGRYNITKDELIND